MTVDVHGVCDRRFQPLKDAFAANFEDELEVGASLAVMLHGETAVDIWAGYRDEKRTQPWERDTIAPVASITKIATALCMLMVIDRGLVELDETVATYWPEFAQGGKDRVTVREALSHRAGVPGLDPPVTFEAWHDWAGITARLAAEPHWFGGESRFFYHYGTYGQVLGEVIRRVDGRGPQRFFREEVAAPAGIDFQIGLSSYAERDRVAQRCFSGSAQLAPIEDATYARAVATAGVGDPDSWERQRADGPTGNGFSNGRGVARLAAIFANGGELDGRRYLSRTLVDEAAREQVFAEDALFGPIRMGLGFGLDSETFPAPAPTSFHWGGQGGALIVADQSVRVGFGYAINNFYLGLDLATHPKFKRIWDALGQVIEGLR